MTIPSKYLDLLRLKDIPAIYTTLMSSLQQLRSVIIAAGIMLRMIAITLTYTFTFSLYTG